MHKIMFVCHGNICRSTMAEFVLKHIAAQNGKAREFEIASSATSREEIGNDTHYGTKQKLRQQGIPFTRRAAVQLTLRDCQNYDYIIGMDYENLRNIERIGGDAVYGKAHLLLEYADESYKGGVFSRWGSVKEIADPWYTGNFDETFDDVWAGCTGLFEFLCG